MSYQPSKPRPSTVSNHPFQTPYSVKSRLSLSFPSEGKTHQSFKDECDINIIMSRYLQTGVLPDALTLGEARYLDVSEVDFQSAMEIVAGSRSLFEQLPSDVRSRFKNDPRELLAFVHDPKNAEEAISLGLRRVQTPEATPTPQPTLSNPTTASIAPANA
jgi:phage internal scaffolding protein